MNLIPWRNKQSSLAPASSLLELRHEMDRLFDRFFTGGPWGAFDGDGGALAAWSPTLDVDEDEKNITVRAELPGLDPNEIDLTVNGRVLTVSGEKKEETERQEKGYRYSERRFGSFRRSVELPAEVDANAVGAEYRKGVLTVTLPKTAASQARRIQVAAATD